MAELQILLVVLVLVSSGTCFGSSDILRKAISKSCSATYTMGCFKMDMVQLVDILDDNHRFTLFPGVDITKDNNSEEIVSKKFPEKLVRNLARSFPNGDSSELDEYLVGRVSQYLRSHSLSVKVGEESSSDHLVRDAAGRKGGGGKGGYGGIIAAAMMMKGMLATLGMGALAALAGKALMTGLMSLMLSAIIGLKSASSGGHKSTTYEIISKPVYSHSHSHSSEIQHEHGGGGGGGHAGYTYGRNLDVTQGKKNEKVTQTSEVQYITLENDKENDEESSEQVEYKTISEDDLKQMQKYGSYVNNLDYGALSGGTHGHLQQGGYRSAKNLPAELFSSTTPQSA